MNNSGRNTRRERIARRVVIFGLPWLFIPLSFIAAKTTFVAIATVIAVVTMGALWAFLVVRLTLGSAARIAGVAVLAVITVSIGIVLGPGWGVVSVFATTAAAWVLSRRSAVVVITAVGVVMVFGLTRHGAVGGKLLDVLVPVVIGLGMIALAEFLALTELVSAQQEELTEMAVFTERNRIAHDLHDSLGHSLMAVLVQVRLVRAQLRWIRDDGIAGTLDTIDGIELSVREAMADLRGTVAGYRSFDVFAMLESVPATLRAANITVLIDAAEGALAHLHEHPEIAEVFGWVLREGATNVLRHSAARTVTIRLCDTSSSVELRLSNDGISTRSSVEEIGGGAGVAGMRERISAIGGSLDIDPGAASFALTALAPLVNESEQNRVAS